MNKYKVKLKDETVTVMADCVELQTVIGEGEIISRVVTFFIRVDKPASSNPVMAVQNNEVAAQFTEYESFYVSEVLPGPIKKADRLDDLNGEIKDLLASDDEREVIMELWVNESHIGVAVKASKSTGGIIDLPCRIVEFCADKTVCLEVLSG